MGNCSGLFANCTGEDAAQNAVRRIDASKMSDAIRANELDRVAGSTNFGVASDIAPHNGQNHYNESQFGTSGTTPVNG